MLKYLWNDISFLFSAEGFPFIFMAAAVISNSFLAMIMCVPLLFLTILRFHLRIEAERKAAVFNAILKRHPTRGKRPIGPGLRTIH